MQHKFIGREKYLKFFEKQLDSPKGNLLRYSGQPGIGKSMLLKRMSEICDEHKHPYIWLNMNGLALSSGLEILFEIARSARHFPEMHKVAKDQQNRLSENWKHQEESINTVMGALEKVDPTGGIAVGLIHSGIDFAQGIVGRKAQEEAIFKNSELFLLNILAKAGEKHPVCFFDTYEHIYKSNAKIGSRIEFSDKRAREWSPQEVALARWMRDFVEYLQSNGWIVVMAGREFIDRKASVTLKKFSKKEIENALMENELLEPYVQEDKATLIALLEQLSFGGNPLWLMVAMNLLERQLSQGVSAKRLLEDQQYLQECFEEKAFDDLGDIEGIEYGACKLNMLNLLMSDTQGVEESWILAIPRVLDRGIIELLFKKEQAYAILQSYQLSGAFSQIGTTFRLHEEIRDLLLAYARQREYLESDTTRAMHEKIYQYLMERYQFETVADFKKDIKEELLKKSNVWILEAAYHKIMQGSLCLRHHIDPIYFWGYLGSSLSLTTIQKLSIATSSLSLEQLSNLIRIFKEEFQKWEKLFGTVTANALLEALREGKVYSY